MLVRIILVLGVALILLSGGAMGWQYWQGLQGQTVAAAEGGGPDAAEGGPGAVAPVAAGPAQGWLISPGGGLVDRDAARAFLRQDRPVQGRGVTARFRAPLAALLAPGEQLPAEAYRAVFADIRAKALAGNFCAELTARWASACAPDRAGVAEGGYDAATDTAEFTVTLAYSEKTPAPLPDLTTQALFTAYGALDVDLGGGLRADTPERLLALAAEAAAQDCATRAPDPAQCRISRLALQWTDPATIAANWQIAWLAPLPRGMYPAPPLY